MSGTLVPMGHGTGNEYRENCRSYSREQTPKHKEQINSSYGLRVKFQNDMKSINFFKDEFFVGLRIDNFFNLNPLNLPKKDVAILNNDHEKSTKKGDSRNIGEAFQSI